jgi:hypothetical protein
VRFAVTGSMPYFGVDPIRIVAFARQAEPCGFEAISYPGTARSSPEPRSAGP